MADQSENKVQFNSDLGGTLTIVSPFHSELDIKPEIDPSINSDEQEFADFEGIFIRIVKFFTCGSEVKEIPFSDIFL